MRRAVCVPSVTLTRNVNVPVSVGAPLSTPAADTARPEGGAPESGGAQVYGPAPHAAARATE